MLVRQLLLATALTSVASFLVPGTANAQDPAFDWSGFYAGFNAGLVGSSTDVDIDGTAFVTPFTDSEHFESTLGSFGVNAGHNWQFDKVVTGVEADLSFFRNQHSSTAPSGTSVESSLENLLSARFKAGYAIDRMMFYGTAGLAVGNASLATSRTDLAKGTAGDARDLILGPTVGLGAEYAVNDNLSLKAEASYYKLGPLTSEATGFSPHTARASHEGSVVKLGANFRF